MGNRLNQDDFVGAGFHRLDDEKIVQHPPKIKWGMIYGSKSLRERLRYAERVAAAMNFAAMQIQGERDELNRLIGLKEKQLKSGGVAMGQNNDMIQQQITAHNEEKQALQEAVAQKNARIRDLEAQLGIKKTV